MPERIPLLAFTNPSLSQSHWEIVANRETEPSRVGPVNLSEDARPNFIYILKKFFLVALGIFKGKTRSWSFA
jgi:hypothetical protein